MTDTGTPATDVAAAGAGGSGAPAVDDRLVWLDLEMTGLDVRRHVIVEIAALVTDGALEPLDDGIDLVVHQPPEALAEMDDFVRAMHTRSALLPEIEASTLSLADAGTQVLEYVRAHVPTAGTAPMCGNSIGVDRRFLDHQLPELDAYLHYRSIDVSSLKELCRRWYPAVYKRRPGKAEAHRALADVRESIAELAFYRDHLLIPSPAASSSATPSP
ncbi:MAG TPA: oligoribonuclease [Acidimicrobiia bacterium]|nr:oligoribonuclease [Acidimicrobiia bacterium]